MYAINNENLKYFGLIGRWPLDTVVISVKKKERLVTFEDRDDFER